MLYRVVLCCVGHLSLGLPHLIQAPRKNLEKSLEISVSLIRGGSDAVIMTNTTKHVRIRVAAQTLLWGKIELYFCF
ncbi:hypothetical protein OF83DRAFT_1159856 [Amylostereum chailletii]|nr:hypothetical protein OF83DRAFT_1159856 [Amylostereum chailletii]